MGNTTFIEVTAEKTTFQQSLVKNEFPVVHGIQPALGQS